MEAVMRANIVIGALAIFLIPACIYTAHTQDRSVVKSNCTVDCYEAGYKWARQRDIDDEDSCPDGDKLFYQGCIAYVGDSSGTKLITALALRYPLVPMTVMTMMITETTGQKRALMFAKRIAWRALLNCQHY